MKIGFIGAGQVGSQLAMAWSAHGENVRAIASRTTSKARQLASQVGAEVMPAHAVLAACDLTLLTVPDDTIAPLAHDLAPHYKGLSGAVVHTSGAHSAGVLAPLAALGANVGSLHPAFPFSRSRPDVLHLQGAVFAIEAESQFLQDQLLHLVARLDGQAMVIPTRHKAAYHAALVMASNYTVTLYAMAKTLLVDAGADETTANHALNVLLAATVDNLASQGVPGALTGPLLRGDVGTIAAHLVPLESHGMAATYRALARQTIPLMQQRGTPPEKIALIEDLLKQVKNGET